MKPQQMSLFDDKAFADNNPLPLIVAKKWGFKLRYVVDDGVYWYSVRDWFAGITNSPNPLQRWQDARIAPEMQPVMQSIRRIMLPDTNGGSPSQVVEDKGLYHIAANLRAAKSRPALAEIKEYLAKAGAFTDLLRRSPEARAELGATAGPEAMFDATVERYEGMGRDPDWIAARLEGVVTRKQFTSALRRAVLNASKSLFSASTEKIYAGLWKRTTAELRGEFELRKTDSLRDHFGEYGLIYTRLAEKVATDKLKHAEVVTEPLAMEIVYAAAKMIRAQAEATSKELGIDLVTEKPLLQSKPGLTQHGFQQALKKVSKPSLPDEPF